MESLGHVVPMVLKELLVSTVKQVLLEFQGQLV